MTIHTGIGDINSAGRLMAYDNTTMLDIWDSESCNHVNGNDGIIFPSSKVHQKRDLDVYVSNICRTLPLIFEKEVSGQFDNKYLIELRNLS
jgi:hypothetical protein